MKKIYLLISILLFSCFLSNTFCQKSFTIIFKYKLNEGIKDSTFFNLYKPINYLNKKEKYQIVNKHIWYKDEFGFFLCTYDIPELTSCFIPDGMGRQFIAIPNDTVTILIKNNYIKGAKFKKSGTYIPWIFDFEYFGVNSHIYTFIDSLASQYGAMNAFPISLNNESVNFDLKKFYSKASEQYVSRLQFLKEYDSIFHLSQSIKELFNLEIKSNYLFTLCRPLRRIDSGYNYVDFPSYYFKDFDIEGIVKNPFFHQTAYSYDFMSDYFKLFIPKKFNYNTSSQSYYPLIINSINGSKLSIKQKQSIIADIIYYIPKNDFSTFSKLLSDYKSLYKNSNFISTLDSLRIHNDKLNQITLVSALKVNLISENNHVNELSGILKNGPVLIDCWAEWCKPCVKEKPFFRNISKDYKNRLKFISLSFDINFEKWKKNLISKSFNNNDEYNIDEYFLEGNFQSAFGQFFNINTIPRYIFIDYSKGMIKTLNNRPTNKALFLNEIDSYFRIN